MSGLRLIVCHQHKPWWGLGFIVRSQELVFEKPDGDHAEAVALRRRLLAHGNVAWARIEITDDEEAA